jgi:hypothetical protein
MRPLPALGSLYAPVHSFTWSDLLVLPLFAKILRSHRRWREFERFRSAELADRRSKDHEAAWASFPALVACERRISPILARSFRFTSDLLLPADSCDSIFTSDDDVDDFYTAMLEVEGVEGIELPDAFWRSFPGAGPYHEFVAYIQGIPKAPNA